MKTIYLVISECRERGTNKAYQGQNPLWAETDKEKALKKCMCWNEEEVFNEGVLELHYLVKEVNLYE